MSRTSLSNITRAFLLLLMVTAIGSCAALPEIGPFVDATVDLRSTVAISGATVEAELRRMNGGQKYADTLATAWQARVQAVDALVVYAESLRAIVKSGQEGAQAVHALAEALTTLARTVGVVIPASGVVGIVTDTATLVYSHIALARAAKSLQAALVLAQPVVEQIARIIAHDLQDADGILQTANADIISSRTTDLQVELGFRQALEQERKGLYARWPGTVSPADEARLLEIDRLLESTNAWYLPFQADNQETAKRLHAGRNIIAAAISTTELWATTHQQLILAVRDKRALNTQALVQAALDIRDLIKRIREL